MSLQWTLIAGVLYTEIVIVLILILPVFSPKRWNRILQSSFVKTLSYQAGWYFYFVLIILTLFLLDAVREMRKYSNIEASDHLGHAHIDAEMQANMRLFRAQRNFFISGFSLFLSLVIRQLLRLISAQATLMAKSEAAIKQAQSASAAASNILNKQNSGGGEGDRNLANESREEHEKEIKELKAKMALLEENLVKTKNDRDAIKSQAESVTKEYDRLMEEHRKLQVNISSSGDKKRE